MNDHARYAHQTEAVDLICAHGGSFCIFAETGTGKTWIGIDAIRALGGPALVVCPLSIIEPAWMADCARIAPDLHVVNLHQPTKRKRQFAMLRKADIYLVNFARFRLMWQDDRRWLADKGFKVLVVDESSKMKSPTAKVTKALLAFGLAARGWPGVPHRIVMSGTPAPNSEQEYWAQVRLVAPKALCESFHRFKRIWFYPAVCDPGNARVVWKWSITKEKRTKLMARIAPHAVFYRKKDCLDLPPQVDEIRHVAMGRDQGACYKAMLDDFVATLDDDADPWQNGMAMATNKLAQLMKLRQITAGCIGVLDGTMVWRWDAKLRALKEVLEEAGGEQAIIWTQFHVEADAICRMLNKGRVAMARARVFDGRSPVKERPSILNVFKQGHVQYLVAHPACAGHGLTLTNCALNVYASLSYSLEQYWQSRDRTHRIGQDRSVTYVHLIVPDSIDEALLKVLRAKGDVARAAAAMVNGWRKKSGKDRQ